MPSFAHIQEEIQNMLDLCEYNLTPEQQQELDEYLDTLALQEAEKVDRLVAFIKIQSMIADSCRKEAKRLQEKAKSADKVVDNLKARYLAIMKLHGLECIKGEAYTLKIGRTERLYVPSDWDGIDDKYFRTTVEPDKESIRRAIKAGEKVGDCKMMESKFLRIY